MPINTDLNFQDYWRIIRRRRAMFFTIWSAVVVTTIIFTLAQTPVYRAEAVLKVDPNISIPEVNQGYDIWSLMNTEVKSVRGMAVGERAGRELGWITEAMTPDQVLSIADGLRNRIQSERLGESNLIAVTAYSDNPKKAADIVNAMAKAYIAQGIAVRSQKAKETSEFTSQELVKAEAKLREAEETLRKFSEESGSFGRANDLSLFLSNYQAQLAELLKTYTRRHPEVIETEKKITRIRDQLRQMPQGEIEYQRLTREVRINEELYTFLSKKNKEAFIAQAEKEQTAYMDSQALVPSHPIRPNRKLNLLMGLVMGFVLGLLSVLLAENLDTSIGTIEEMERYLSVPVLAMVPNIDLDASGGRKRLQFPFHFAHPPTLDEMRRRLVIYHPLKSSFAEAYHTLRTNLQFHQRPGMRPGRVLGFTSAGVSEGKTLTALNFSLTAAESGLKVLFIEADLRRPSAHKLLGLKREPGLTDSVLRNCTWRDAVQGTADFLLGDIKVDQLLKAPGIENFRFLPCGQSPSNPADILGAPEMDSMMQQVRNEFDMVVFDCAPVMLFADSLLVGPRSDGMILVYKAGRTARGALKRAKDQLVNVHSRILGVVLNDLRSMEMEPDYSYYYAYREEVKTR